MYVLGVGERLPEPDPLEAYAAARGLKWSREAALRPWAALFGADEDENWNTMRGTLPGGASGVMGHRVTGVRERGGEDRQMRRSFEPATFAAVLAPETKATLGALEARQCRTYVDYDHGVRLGERAGAGGWTVGTGPRTDEATLSALWDGPVGEWVRATFPGGRLDVRAGIASLWMPGFVSDPAVLDGLGASIAWAGAALRTLCSAPAPPWDQSLPAPPAWGAPGKRRDDLGQAVDKAGGRVRADSPEVDAHVFDPGATADGVYAGVRDFAAAYAQARGLTLEDGRAFDLAHRGLPFPGWAQCVWRGDGLRLVLTAQRPLSRVVATTVQGAVAVIVPSGGDEPLHFDDGRKLWVATGDGFRTAWTTHRNLEVTHATLDGLLSARA
jgi:hypothetical protein